MTLFAIGVESPILICEGSNQTKGPKFMTDKEIEEEIKSIMQGMTFENEEERNKFEADLRAQFQLRRSLLYDERGNPLSPIIVANDGKKGSV